MIEERAIPGELVGPTIALLESFSLSAWVYRGEEWYVRDLHGPHVEHESHTVQFAADAGRRASRGCTTASPRSSA